MDVPTSKNVTQVDFVTPSAGKTQEEGQRNRSPTPKVDDPQHDKMRNLITYLVLSLFVFIVIYGLVMHIWLLVGTFCVSIVGKGVLKIFDRYL